MRSKGILELRILGPIELRRDGVLVEATAWRRGRVRALLTYLVLNRTGSRARIADALWPHLGAEAQSRNLRVTLTHLRRVLEPDRPRRAPSFFLREHGSNIVLHPGHLLRIDLWDLDGLSEHAAAAERRGATKEFVRCVRRAVEHWRGDPDDAACEPWAFQQIEQRRARLAITTTRAAELVLAAGCAEQARGLAERALMVDRWHEPAYRVLIATHRHSGDELSAHRCLQRYRASIYELGLDSQRTSRMVEQLLESVPNLAVGSHRFDAEERDR